MKSQQFPATPQQKIADYVHPYPCGYYGDPQKACTCSSSTVTRNQKCIPGPMLNCIDIHIQAPRVNYEKLSDTRMGEPSKTVRERVEAVHERQRMRFDGLKDIS